MSGLRFFRQSLRVVAPVSAGAALASSAWFATAACEDKHPKFLDPNEWKPLKVVKVEKLTHDSKHIWFALPSKDHQMGLNVASCLTVKAEINGENVIRPYTPVNMNEDLGRLELCVKGYPDGKMSKHIVNLKPGDELEFKGPWQKIEYAPNKWKHIGLIAGGSGITPILQVARKALMDPSDKTQISIILANRTPNDIMCGNLLKELEENPRVKILYIVDKADKSWKGGVGYITKDVIRKHMPGPEKGNIIMVCGPPPMMKAICGDKDKKEQGPLAGILKEMGYTSETVFKF